MIFIEFQLALKEEKNTCISNKHIKYEIWTEIFNKNKY